MRRDEDRTDDFEERVTHALRGASDEFPPHSADLVNRSVARGRRMRLIGAARIAAAAVTVVAVGGTLTATDALGTWRGTGGRLGAEASAGAPASAGTASSAQAPSSISGEEMVRILKSLLPPGGTVSAASGRGSRSDGPDVWPRAKLTYSTAAGSSGVDISIARLSSGLPADQQGASGCLPVEVRPYDKCTTRKLPGGAVLSTTESFTYPSSDTGQKRWYVVLTTAGGAQLTAQEFGGGGEKGATGGADPLLSTAQLTAIVRSPAWNRAIEALPARDTAPGDPARTDRADGARLTRVLRSHLPRGTVSDINSGAGIVQLVHDDGRGRNMVEVDVQYDMTPLLARHMGCAGVPDDCEAGTLPDGTRIKRVRTRSEKGGPASVWLVDTLRTDGRRVTVREINSYAESTPVTRPRPELSLDRLQEIALDEEFFAS
ncbi:hypothetical protein ACFQ9Z_12625 [Streptomyces sp. NPDC056580]|uniref:hypothetical protein n=1 Tax=Streptomyces sp. NPDC056580 TaxID=3345872 RepID=UPI0036A7043D